MIKIWGRTTTKSCEMPIRIWCSLIQISSHTENKIFFYFHDGLKNDNSWHNGINEIYDIW